VACGWYCTVVLILVPARIVLSAPALETGEAQVLVKAAEMKVSISFDKSVKATDGRVPQRGGVSVAVLSLFYML
jgi:hypothetical protein